ncbi:Fis family transcriptional regulator [Pseudomonas sp. FW300-N1A1]|nr:Fis family transcriptional regulator [Pseudomonas sp. FW300-N1A1]
MLKRISARLDVDPVALLAMASSYERQESLAEFLAHLQGEMKKLEALGVLSGLPSHFEGGNLITAKAGKRPIPNEKIQAVLACKAEGMTQKQTSMKLGMAASTVHKIWHSDF